jgi:mono/diheme cytochrome c family protein
MRCAASLFGAVLQFASALAVAQSALPPDVSERIRLGADVYARNCSPCHGSRMLDPQGAFDLRQFPHDQRDRFISSVTHGKNQMPPWGDLLKPEELDALWAYVTGGDGVSGR